MIEVKCVFQKLAERRSVLVQYDVVTLLWWNHRQKINSFWHFAPMGTTYDQIGKPHDGNSMHRRRSSSKRI